MVGLVVGLLVFVGLPLFVLVVELELEVPLAGLVVGAVGVVGLLLFVAVSAGVVGAVGVAVLGAVVGLDGVTAAGAVEC